MHTVRTIEIYHQIPYMDINEQRNNLKYTTILWYYVNTQNCIIKHHMYIVQTTKNASLNISFIHD